MLLPVIEPRPRELPLGAPAGAVKNTYYKECLSSAEGVIRKRGEEFDTGSAPEVASWTDPEDTHLYTWFPGFLSSRKL